MTDQPQGPQGPKPKKRNFFLRHKILSAVLAVLLLFIVIGISNGGSKSATTTTAATPPTSTQAQAPAATTSAGSAYVDKQTHDANIVVVSYQEVQAAVQILQGSPDAATMAGFQQILSQAKDGFDTAEHSFVLAGAPAGTGTANKEAAAAIREFSDAMSSARDYVDTKKPSDLASFGTHWKQGKVWWNEAVGKLWGAANMPAPTV